jgi:hypothetical protein
VTVRWEDGDYAGTVAAIKPRKKLYLIDYEDGDSYWERFDPVLQRLVTGDVDSE